MANIELACDAYPSFLTKIWLFWVAAAPFEGAFPGFFKALAEVLLCGLTDGKLAGFEKPEENSAFFSGP